MHNGDPHERQESHKTDPLGLQPGDRQFEQPRCGGSGHTATLSRQGGPGSGAPQGTGEEVEHLPVFPCGDEGALPGWRPMPGAIPCTRGASDREIVQQCLEDVRAFAPDPKPDPGRIGSLNVAPTPGSTINGGRVAAKVDFRLYATKRGWRRRRRSWWRARLGTSRVRYATGGPARGAASVGLRGRYRRG